MRAPASPCPPFLPQASIGQFVEARGSALAEEIGQPVRRIKNLVRRWLTAARCSTAAGLYCFRLRHNEAVPVSTSTTPLQLLYHRPEAFAFLFAKIN